METTQINLKLPENLLKAAISYAKTYGYRNIQELTTESLREKVYENERFDESFSDHEIELIDSLIEISTKQKKIVSESEFNLKPSE